MTLKVLKANPNLKLKQAKLAIIDIGSNSIRMLIYDDFTSSRVPFFNEKAVCELGKNLDKSRKLHHSGKIYALKVLKRFSEILNVSQITNLKIIATAVLREASDARSFTEEVEKLFQKKIEILSGDQEAECAAEGVKIGFENVDGLVADLGGGSLELARVENNVITNKTSLPLGVLRLINNPIIKKRNLSKYIKGFAYCLTLYDAYSAKYIPLIRPIGIATHIAMKAIKKVPAKIGTAPKVSEYIVGSNASDESLTKAFAGYQWVPKTKSNKGITLKKSIVWNINEKTIPTVVKIAAKEAVNKTALKNFSTGSLVRLFKEILLYA